MPGGELEQNTYWETTMNQTTPEPPFLIAFLLSLLLNTPSALTANSNKFTTANFDHSFTLWTEILKYFVVIKGPASQVKYKDL